MKTSFNLKYKHFRLKSPIWQKSKKTKIFSLSLNDWFSNNYPFAYARKRTVLILRGLHSISLKNNCIFILCFQFYFVLLLCSQTETREDKSKNKKSFFHIFTIDLKRLFIRNGNETGQINNFVDSQSAKISTLQYINKP